MVDISHISREDIEDICREFRQTANAHKQIKISSELHLLPQEAIIRVLQSCGYNPPIPADVKKKIAKSGGFQKSSDIPASEHKEEKKRMNKRAEAEKFTIYLDKPIAKAFRALCIRHGDQQKYANEAFSDLIEKKSKELDII